MKRLTTMILSGCLVLSGCGGEQTPDEPPPSEPDAVPSAASVPAEAPDAAQADPSAQAPAPDAQTDVNTGGESDPIEAAKKLIAEMVRAYQAAPAMTDRIVIEHTMAGQNPEPQTLQIDLGSGRDVRLRNARNVITAVDGFFYITDRRFDDRYFKVELVEDLLETTKVVLGGPGGLGSAHCALRYDKPIDEIIAALAFGLSELPRISSYRLVTDNEGRQFEQLTLVSGTGHAVVNVDPRTKFIASIDTENEPRGAPPGFRTSQRITFEPQVHQELPEPIVFDGGDRMPVDSLRALNGMAPKQRQPVRLKVQPGQPAPAFTLFTLEGSKVELSESAGSVVVLEFWSSGCLSCGRINMPQVRQFAQWAEASGLPVTVYFINTQQLGDTPEQNWQRAFDSWERWELTLPSLIDPENRVAREYGVAVVPTTVIIDAEGRIVSAACGDDENLARSLREEVTALLNGGP